MRIFWRLVSWLILLGILALIAFAGYQAFTFKPGVNPTAVTEMFTDPSLPNWSLKLVDGIGVAQPPPYHGGDILLENGTLRLQVSPDPDFSNESSTWQPGQAAAPQYNNVFAIGMPDFAPTWQQTVIAEFQMKIDAGYQGTSGLWIEARDTFDQQGVMVPGGFPGAIGVSITSSDSTKLLAGVRFEYVKGLIPLCLAEVGGVNPSAWNVYRIEWKKVLGFADQYDLFVNGQHKAFCFIPLIGFRHSEIQVWSDNYKIGDLFQIGYLNPLKVQGTLYKEFKIWVENNK
jgi:hypothetical protein